MLITVNFINVDGVNRGVAFALRVGRETWKKKRSHLSWQPTFGGGGWVSTTMCASRFKRQEMYCSLHILIFFSLEILFTITSTMFILQRHIDLTND